MKLKNTLTTHWTEKIKTKEDYDALVKTGLAWEFLIDLPLSWAECKKILEEIEEEGFERSGN
ncbi:hypothetical protein D3C85_1517390 [compost metagenome]